jgi:hypothetical protein
MAIAVSVTTMKAAQVTGAKAGLEIVEREIPEPGRFGHWSIRVEQGTAGRCGLARRSRWYLSRVPAWRFSQLPQSEDHRNQL